MPLHLPVKSVIAFCETGSGEEMKSLLLLLSAGLMAMPLSAEEGELFLALGGFNVGKSDSTAMAQVEYRFAADWYGIRPQAGFFVTEDSASYWYGGVAYPWSINDNWSLTPSLAAGYYNNGADKDLGYDVEFYSQLLLEYRLDNNAQIGLGVGHISNADIGDFNPGAETAYLSYRFSF